MQQRSCSSTMNHLMVHVVLMISVVTMEALKLPPNVTVTALIGFGDSIIDPGNNNDRKTFSKSNFPPYGKDFKGGIPTGRFTNGRIPTDIIAEALSLKEYLPAYSDPNLGPHDLLTGVCFASAACGYDPLTSKIASAASLCEQLDQFKEYTGKLKQLAGEERTQFILSNAIYLLVVGTNDIATNYFDSPIRKKQYDIEAYTDLMINYASSFIQDLYKLGARRIAVFGAPPIGCVPCQRTMEGGIMRECSEKMNDAALLFNSKLSTQLDFLTSKLPNSRVVYINIYDPLLNLIQYPDNYGFEQVKKGCCGTGLMEVSMLCNKFDRVCPDASKYLFWDCYHPTEHGYVALINQILDKYLNILLS